MGITTPPQPSSPGPWWWVPNVFAMLVGLGLVGLAVYDHDNQSLMVVGTGLVTGAVGHAIGVQSPTP